MNTDITILIFLVIVIILLLITVKNTFNKSNNSFDVDIKKMSQNFKVYIVKLWNKQDMLIQK